MVKFKHLLLMSIMFVAAPDLAYADDRIDCPADRIESRVVTPLPPNWFSIPQNERLRDTRIERDGNRRVLVCAYGPAGSVRMPQPDNTECRTTRSGFMCRPDRHSNNWGPETYRTGTLDVPQTYLFDLDQGRVTDAGADLWFQAETRIRKFLTPRNGAQASISGPRNRGYRDCSRADFSSRSISLGELPVGTYVCVRTNEGRISEFRLNALVPSGELTTLRIGFTTWRNER